MSTTIVRTLTPETRAKIEQLINELKSEGNFFRLKSNQPPQTLTFDMNFSFDKVTRKFNLDGNIKEITRYSFSVWNQSVGEGGRCQLFEMSNKWTKNVLQILLENNTNTVTADCSLSCLCERTIMVYQVATGLY
jgi:hypothetical protein